MENEEDLELLLSLQDGDGDESDQEAIPATPPRLWSEPPSPPHFDLSENTRRSPVKARMIPCHIPDMASVMDQRKKAVAESHNLGYCSDEDLRRPKHAVSMTAFKDVVQDILQSERVGNGDSSSSVEVMPSSKKMNNYSDTGVELERLSGLRIMNRVGLDTGTSSIFSDVRLVRLQAIKMTMMGDKFHGAWATIGVLVEKGKTRLSSTGKKYAIWKLSSLDKNLVAVFVFAEAYNVHWKESVGSILAIFDASIRSDVKTKDPSLSVFKKGQVLKLGMSVDYGVCMGARKDGTKCSTILNKRYGQYCQYHLVAAQQKYKTARPELTGGKYAIRGISGTKRDYLPRSVVSSPPKENQWVKPVKHMTSAQLKEVLSNTEKMRATTFSQGKRFLHVMAEGNPVKRQATTSDSGKESSWPSENEKR